MRFSWLIPASLLLSVTDSCDMWSREHSVKDYPNVRIQFVDSKTGFIVGPKLIRTVDGGQSWHVTEYRRIDDALRAEGNLESYTNKAQFIDREWVGA